MGGINPIVLTVSLITLMKSGAEIGHGTGFFYSSGDRLFLVTNQHVFRDPDKNSFPDTFRLRLHTDANDVSKNATFDLPIYAASQPLWKTHSTYPQADVAVIEIVDSQFTKKFLVKSWSKESLLPPKYVLDPGEDIFIMGYPLSFHDTRNNLPIFRNAMIASTYGVGFKGNPYFLTDANLHPGTSGSPVITKPKNVWIDESGNTNMVTGTVYYLLGIHSGIIDRSSTMGQEIGLGAAWYANLIEDIVSRK